MALLTTAYFTQVQQNGGGGVQLANQVQFLEQERFKLQWELALKNGEVEDLTSHLEQERQQIFEQAKKLEEAERVIVELREADEEACRREVELKQQLAT